MIVHRDELFKTTQDTDSTSYKTAFTSGTGSRLSDPGVESLKVGDLNTASFRGSGPTTDTIQSSLPSVSNLTEQNLKTKGTHRAQAGIMRNSTLKNETVSRKFALQDKLWSIYAAGNTVPIPFLRATDISPIALLSDNVFGGMQQDTSGTGTVEALQELFSGDGQCKKGRRGINEQMPLPPSICQRLTSSSTLMNLGQALAYHKMYAQLLHEFFLPTLQIMCYEDMPLQELQATQEQRTIQNLSDTLRTILRL
ncbi:serine/threonine protein kinase [Trifolium pratense]|uniref:Serine/threonine protein kinase n=2 Tax=Trifolium pratense TaxID=57577 RepID=A0A2K3NCN6_TRIPR|nr:serine/threonine protein kinase [Trifolium pratense]